MTDVSRMKPGEKITTDAGKIIIQVEPPATGRRLAFRLLFCVLIVSVVINLGQWLTSVVYAPRAIAEMYHSGTVDAADRIAVIPIEGTITPPFTGRWLRQIKQAEEDDTVRGVVLLVDSPGGFVADSHQLYRRIQQLAEKKPVSVSMKRLAASGGYYLAMGIGPNGRIFAEPTTWTGSIGVIIPRYNAAELSKSIGVKVEPLVTGPFKDSLNPFRDLSANEKKVWDAILQDSFDRFVGVITTGRRDLNDTQVRELATGQIYTANQALTNHMVDEIGYLEDAVAAMSVSLKLSDYEAFEYRSTPGLIDYLIGAHASSNVSLPETLLQSTVPKAMYYCSWNPWVPVR
jgi:protease IV